MRGGAAHSMQKFLGQGSNPSHSSYNAKSSTTRPPGNSTPFFKRHEKVSFPLWIVVFLIFFKLGTFYYFVSYLEPAQLEADYLRPLPCRLATNLDLPDWSHEGYPPFEKIDLTLDREHRGHLRGHSQNELLHGSKR